MTQEEREAKQFERVKFARDHHNQTCTLGPAIEVHLNPFDISRMQWEEGDVIATLLLVANHKVQPDKLRIYCAGDKEGSGPEMAATVELPTPETVDIPDFKVPDFMPVVEPAYAKGESCCSDG